MLAKYFSFAALLGAAVAQDQNLTATVAGAQDLSTLGQILTQLQLLPMLEEARDITILAPTNEAFAKINSTDAGKRLLQDSAFVTALLQYHLINGTYFSQNFTNTVFVPTMLTNSAYTNVTGGQRVEVVPADGSVSLYSGLLKNSTVTQADVRFRGGVIHVINEVLTLPSNASSTALGANLTALYGALGKAELVTAVDTTKDVTIFAPVNEAFTAIGSALANITKEDLQSILTYHVVSGTVGYSTDLKDGATLKTLNGADLTVHIENGNVFVNSAKVVVPNVLVANGVVHVIDQVLNPQSAGADPQPSASQGSPAFSASSGSIPFTSNLPSATGVVNPAPTGATGGAASSSLSQAGAMPMQTAMAGAAMFFGGAAAMMMQM